MIDKINELNKENTMQEFDTEATYEFERGGSYTFKGYYLSSDTAGYNDVIVDSELNPIAFSPKDVLDASFTQQIPKLIKVPTKELYYVIAYQQSENGAWFIAYLVDECVGLHKKTWFSYKVLESYYE